MVNKISEETRRAINRKSAYALPDAPTEVGMGADEIRRAFWKPITDEKQSALGELDRVADEINEELEAREAKLIGMLPDLEREVREADEHVETLQTYMEMLPTLEELAKQAEESAEKAKESAAHIPTMLSKKLDKVTTTASAWWRVYGVTATGEQKMYTASYQHQGNLRVAIYAPFGCLRSKTPIESTDAANKAYVDKVMSEIGG